MMDDLTSIIIVGMVILGPIWLTFHFRAKGQRTSALTAQDAAMIEQLTQTAIRMESRMVALERILDAEVPAWRSSYEAGGLP